jgi:hypothetical protein
VLKTHLAYAQTLTLKTVQELREQKPRNGIIKLDYLKVFDGFQCLPYSTFLTTYLPRMRRHMSTHGRKANEHKTTPLWQECRLQTYFTAGIRINYFVIAERSEACGGAAFSSSKTSLSQPEKDLFLKLEMDSVDAKDDIEEQASIVRSIINTIAELIPPSLGHLMVLNIEYGVLICLGNGC